MYTDPVKQLPVKPLGLTSFAALGRMLHSSGGIWITVPPRLRLEYLYNKPPLIQQLWSPRHLSILSLFVAQAAYRTSTPRSRQ
jgi:hypothetical protein